MLSTISWPQYLAALAVTSTCYYSYVFLRYYKREISILLTGKTARSVIAESTKTAPISVIGEIKEDDLISFLDDKELPFAAEEQIESTDFDQQMPMASNTGTDSLQQQLLKEADELIAVFAGVDDKGEFLSLLAILADTYRQYATAVDFSGLEAHLLQEAPAKLHFALSSKDLSVIKN
jgi:hypothetical protein